MLTVIKMITMINLQAIFLLQQLAGTELPPRDNEKPKNPASLHILAEELEVNHGV